MTKALILIGFMGAGKSTIGRLIAEKLQRNFIDTDELLQQRQGQTIAAIMEAKGVLGFREAEFDALQAAIQTGGVIATGGGIIDYEPSFQLLKTTAAQIVYLHGDFTQHLDRIMRDSQRPLLRTKSITEFVEMWDLRQSKYAVLANVTLSSFTKAPTDVLLEIEMWLKNPRTMNQSVSKQLELKKQIERVQQELRMLQELPVNE